MGFIKRTGRRTAGPSLRSAKDRPRRPSPKKDDKVAGCRRPYRFLQASTLAAAVLKESPLVRLAWVPCCLLEPYRQRGVS
jgi:hypothetical protein